MDITLLHKKVVKETKKTIDQSAFQQHCQKYLKEFSLSECQFSLIIFYQNNNVALEKDIVTTLN